MNVSSVTISLEEFDAMRKEIKDAKTRFGLLEDAIYWRIKVWSSDLLKQHQDYMSEEARQRARKMIGF